MREFEYHLCDVFTSRPLEGNQLAVFPDALGLTEAEMQGIARETNLSETTFVLRREPEVEEARGVRVRIFTTQEELPFAGHPTLGSAATIRRLFPEFSKAEKVALDLTAGQIAVTFPPQLNGEGKATFGEMKQLDPVFGATHEASMIAPLLGLHPNDIAETPPQTVSTGLPFCITVLRSLEGLQRLRLNAAESHQYLRSSGARFLYTVAPESPGVWRARMQFYNGEDPATGSAAGCAISYLVRHGLWSSGEQLHLRQRVEMGRPSDLYLSASIVNGKTGEVRVGGSTAHVATGRFFLP